MPPIDRVFFALGALYAFLGVTAGAFGAHALKSRLTPDMLAVFEVAVRYQMYHAFALIVCAWAATKWPGMLVNTSGWLFVAGTIVFSGSLYALSLSGVRWLGAITPLGGLAFLAAGLFLVGGLFLGRRLGRRFRHRRRRDHDVGVRRSLPHHPRTTLGPIRRIRVEL